MCFFNILQPQVDEFLQTPCTLFRDGLEQRSVFASLRDLCDTPGDTQLACVLPTQVALLMVHGMLGCLCIVPPVFARARAARRPAFSLFTGLHDALRHVQSQIVEVGQQVAEAQSAQKDAGDEGLELHDHDDERLFSGHRFHELHMFLLQCAPTILQTNPDAELSLRGHLHWLDEATAAISGGVGAGIMEKNDKGKWQYTATKLVQSLLLSRKLRCRSNLKRVIEDALKLILPAQLVQDILLAASAGHDKMSVPSTTVLSKANLFVDAAFMLTMQRRFQRELEHADDVYLRFPLIDGSPYGGRHWQNFEMRMVKRSNLCRVAQA